MVAHNYADSRRDGHIYADLKGSRITVPTPIGTDIISRRVALNYTNSDGSHIIMTTPVETNIIIPTRKGCT